MAKRGFFAELHHQSRVAAREREQNHKAALREQARAIREAELQQKRLESDAKQAHIVQMQAEVEELNADLAAINDDIDSLLAATLDVDDYVDLESLRQTAVYPPFERTDLEQPNYLPPASASPPEPQYLAPRDAFFPVKRKKRTARKEERSREEFAAEYERWRLEVEAVAQRRAAQLIDYQNREDQRSRELAVARSEHEAVIEEIDTKVAVQNAELDTLITNLDYGVPEAVEEYISIVLSNSVYPEHFPVQHEFAFNPDFAELSLRALIPGPDSMPTIKSYRYVKSNDEIVPTKLSQKAMKDQYANALNQVALRTLHEVFEADRRNIVQTISLEVGTHASDPATGRETYHPLVAVAADRSTFVTFELADVVPRATLDHLGASISKQPLDLVHADVSGIKRI